MKFVLFSFFLITRVIAFTQDTICTIPDTYAEFSGGSGALKAFIDKNQVYPREAIDSGYQGLCFVSFLVCEDGTCQNFKIRYGIADCPECDQEAIRILKLMPKWKPALLAGKPVPVNHTLKIVFQLQDPAKQDEMMERRVEIFVDPETPPEFPGGTPALNKWLSENMRYPRDAQEYSLMGRCYVKFTVGSDGVCRDFRLLRGVTDCLSCDREALRLVSLMPKWKPGLLDGKPIEMSMSVAITFKLN